MTHNSPPPRHPTLVPSPIPKPMKPIRNTRVLLAIVIAGRNDRLRPGPAPLVERRPGQTSHRRVRQDDHRLEAPAPIPSPPTRWPNGRSTRRLLEQTPLRCWGQPLPISIAVAALISRQGSLLIADMVPVINRFPNKPLILQRRLEDSVIYWLMATLIHYVERLIDFWRQTGGFVAGNEKLKAEIIWPHFWAISDHSVRPSCHVLHDLHELVGVMGREKVLCGDDSLGADAPAGSVNAYRKIGDLHHGLR